eukprot:TRINITY_DN14949_c0_g1_i1.p1 TRINITY_DN14949_c0_g1~~TRINITY_DN14949_c0_g1_i1.p1  ORF type:complete len:273 (+),score=70.43 TRINITY_DN14949_c0_g1_i1:187-1005(+)
MNVSLSCQLCDGDPRFCPCHKHNQLGGNSNQNAHKPTTKKKDMIHCTICHMPKAKHDCSLVPCLDPQLCGKPRLHRKQGNRGYHDTIVTTIFTPESNVDQSPTKKRQRATEIPGNWGIPRQYSEYEENAIQLESVVAPHGEEERTREFIVSLADFITNWDPSFASVEGRMMSLKLATMTHTQMLAMKRTMKTKHATKEKKSDSSSYEDGEGDEKDNENHLEELHHDTFEEHDQSNVFLKEEHEEVIQEEVVVEHSLTGFNLSSRLIYDHGDA